MARPNTGFVIEVTDRDYPAYLRSVDPTFSDWISAAAHAYRFPTRAAADLAHDGAADALSSRGATDQQLERLQVLPAADLPRRRRS